MDECSIVESIAAEAGHGMTHAFPPIAKIAMALGELDTDFSESTVVAKGKAGRQENAAGKEGNIGDNGALVKDTKARISSSGMQCASDTHLGGLDPARSVSEQQNK